MGVVYTNMQKYNEPHKAIFRVEKEKIKALKYIALELDKNMGELANEGIDYVLEKYKQYKKKY